MLRAASPGAGFTLALALSLAGLPRISFASWIVIPLIMIAARVWLGPRVAPAPEPVKTPTRRARKPAR